MKPSLLTTEKLRLEVEKKWIEHVKLCQDNFLYFVKEVWPDFIYRKTDNPKKLGHHQIIANEFTKIASLRKGRLIINMPPRHTKSEFASVYFPAWIIGRFPKLKIMQVSHNTELAVGSVLRFVTLLIHQSINKFLETLDFVRTLRQKVDGKLVMVVNTMQLASERLSRVVELTY